MAILRVLGLSLGFGYLAIAFDASAQMRIDVTGVETFAQLHQQLIRRGIVLHLSGIKLPVLNALRKAGQLQDSAHLRLYRTDAEALQALRQLAPLPDDIGAMAI